MPSLILHVRLNEEDDQLLTRLAAATGRKKATLAALGIGHFVRDPRIRALEHLEGLHEMRQLQAYLLDNPAALELVDEARRQRLDSYGWAVLLKQIDRLKD